MQCRWIWDESLPWHVWSITWYARCLHARLPTEGDQEATVYYRFSRDVASAMLAYRTIAKKSFGNLILLLRKTWATFCHCFVHHCFSAMSFLLVIQRAICGAWILLTRHNGLEFLKTTPITTKRVKTLYLCLWSENATIDEKNKKKTLELTLRTLEASLTANSKNSERSGRAKIPIIG